MLTKMKQNQLFENLKMHNAMCNVINILCEDFTPERLK